MIIFNLLFSNSAYGINIVFTTILFILMFFALGRIIQNQFDLKKNFSSLAFPIGFFAYVTITQIFYFIFLLDILNLSNDILVVMEIIKNMFLWIMIILLYKIWFPKINLNRIRFTNALMDITIVILTIGIFFLLTIFVYPTTAIEGSYYESLIKIGQIPGYDFTIFGSEEAGFFQAIVQYQSFYYWISTLSTITSNTEQYLDTTEIFSKYVIPLFVLISVSCASVHSFSKNNHPLSKGVSLGVSLLFGFLLALLGPLTNEFYTCGILMVISILLFAYAYDASPDNGYIYIVLSMTVSSTSFTLWSTYVIIFVGIISVLLTIIRSGNIIRNWIHFLLIFISIQVIFWSISLIEYPEKFNTVIVYIIAIFILSFAALMPMYSLYFSSNRRKDLNSFERKTSDRSHYWIWFVSISTTLFIIGFNLLVKNYELFYIVQSFFAKTIVDNTMFSYISFILLIWLPIVLIYIFKYLGYENTFLTLFVFVNVIFNPFVLSEIFTSFNIDIIWPILYIPSAFIAISWILSVILRLLPKTLRL